MSKHITELPVVLTRNQNENGKMAKRQRQQQQQQHTNRIPSLYFLHVVTVFQLMVLRKQMCIWLPLDSNINYMDCRIWLHITRLVVFLLLFFCIFAGCSLDCAGGLIPLCSLFVVVAHCSSVYADFLLVVPLLSVQQLFVFIVWQQE